MKERRKERREVSREKDKYKRRLITSEQDGKFENTQTTQYRDRNNSDVTMKKRDKKSYSGSDSLTYFHSPLSLSLSHSF